MLWGLGAKASLVRMEDFESVPALFLIGLLFLILILLVVFFTRRWFFARHRIIARRITAEYEAPLDLNAAEMSFLFRKKLDEKVFAGLLVSMSQRGIIHFRKQQSHKIVLAGPRYDSTINEYEKRILDFLDEHRSIPVRDVLTAYNRLYEGQDRSGSFTSAVRSDLERRGMIRRVYIVRYLASIVKGVLLVLGSVLWTPIIALWLYSVFAQGSSDFTNLDDLFYTGLIYSLLLFVPVGITMVGVRHFQARSTGRRWVAQQRLQRYWPHIVGFRLFVCLSEKERLHFESKSLQKASSINTLPYAIAFGLVPNWRDILV